MSKFLAIGLALVAVAAQADTAALDVIVERARSNDWAAVSNAWRTLDMRKGDEVKVIRAAAKVVPVVPETVAMRREMATKLQLLDADPVPELADVEPYGVHVVRPAVLTPDTLDVRVQAIPGLSYSVLDVITLQPGVLQALGIQVPVVQADIVVIDNERFCTFMQLWERRYSRMIDFRDAKGNRLVPAPGTVLWRERDAVIRAVEAGGDYDALWDAYHERLAIAVHRRENLKGRGRR